MCMASNSAGGRYPRLECSRLALCTASYEVADVGFGFLQAPILFQVHLPCFQGLKKLPALALSYGLPLPDMLIRAPASSSRSTYSPDAYCPPQFEW